MVKYIVVMLMCWMLNGIVNAQGINYERNLSWEQVRQKAKEEGRYILLDCYATWCAPCKEMDRQTFTDPRVVDLVNQHFVTMRVQCDTAKSDAENVKARYSDAHEIMKEFHINAYPTFLFFSPEGNLVHKGIGYHIPEAFTNLAQSAMDTSRQYFTLIKDYQAGKLDYNRMRYLADLAEQYEDKKLRASVARSYINGYLNKLPDSSFCKRKMLDSMQEYLDIFRTDDRIIIWLRNHPAQGDSLLRKKGISAEIFDQVIFFEHTKPAMEQAKERATNPDWKTLNENVVRLFGSDHYDAILMGQIDWYQSKNDSENLARALVERIEYLKNVKDVSDPANRETLNLYAFGVFQNTSDKKKLEIALGWMDLVVNVLTDSSIHAAEMIDTKANLLYKLGKNEEAIALETRAIKIKPRDKELAVNFRKMQLGKPTW